MSASIDIRVTQLNVYPVKSCRRVSVSSVRLDEFGVCNDRRFMLVDGNGRFLSQRRYPILATVTATLETEEAPEDNGAIRRVKMSSPHVDWDLEVEPRRDGKVVQVGIWEDKALAVDQGEKAAEWIRDLLKTGMTYNRLVTIGEIGTKRPVRIPSDFPSLPDRQLSFTDEAPVLLLSEESLTNLNTKMKERTGTEVVMDRFRPNIVVSGCTNAFDEDSWLLIEIGNVKFMAYNKAERCKMTGIDQLTGEVDKHGPLHVLREYRAPRGPGHAEFGQHIIPLSLGGQLQLGDKVKVISLKTSV